MKHTIAAQINTNAVSPELIIKRNASNVDRIETFYRISTVRHIRRTLIYRDENL